MKFDDQELIRALREGRETAWWYYYCHNKKKLQKHIEKRFNNYEDHKEEANSAIDEAIIVVRNKIIKFKTLPEMESYLFQTIRSRYINELKKRNTMAGRIIPFEEKQFSDDDNDDQEASIVGQIIPFQGKYFEDQTEEEARYASFRNSCYKYIEENITERNREIFKLHLLNWDTHKIAHALKMKPHQVLKSKNRTIKKLQEAFKKGKIKFIFLIIFFLITN